MELKGLGSKTREKIRRIVGSDNCSDRPEDLYLYAFDAMNRRFLPEMVAHPADASQISSILKLANADGFPVVPRGAGTGLTGGSLPVAGGLILTTSRLNRIIGIDRENMTAWVESGVINGDLQAEVEKQSLFFPPDPSSAKFSTLGGNAAENAGGSRAVKYGVTRDYVMALEVVMPTGEIIHTGSAAMKSVTGYDLTRLLVGSEGTLGVITRLLLKLIPKPQAVGSMLTSFPEVRQACMAVTNIMTSRIVPSTLEFMDRSAIDCVKDYLDLEIPSEAAALLLIEVDGPPGVVEDQVAILENVCREAGAILFQTASTPEERESLWKARRSISPAIMKIRPLKINEDVAVPRMKIPDLIQGVEEIAGKRDVRIVNFGHAGDGNVHVNLLIDPEDKDEVARAHTALEDLFKLTVSLGGSLTGEHGIGIAKAPFMYLEVDKDTMDVMRRIKRALDPNNILNPHKTFDYEPDIADREIRAPDA
ncbi:MAG: FAD-binding protein [Deltaproteobacteria bacterium]|nr:FAD-binding protein [Deltaproteobacteria bacterium]